MISLSHGVNVFVCMVLLLTFVVCCCRCVCIVLQVVKVMFVPCIVGYACVAWTCGSVSHSHAMCGELLIMSSCVGIGLWCVSNLATCLAIVSANSFQGDPVCECSWWSCTWLKLYA